jgi:predicted nucleic acid-binding Zn ribbon protein
MQLIVTCVQLLSGIFVFVRVVDACRTKNILSQRECVVVKFIFVVIWSTCLLTFGLGHQLFFLLNVVVFVPAYVLFKERRRQNRLRIEVYELLQTLILRLGAGESLSSALMSAKKSCSADLKIFLESDPHTLRDRQMQQVRQELHEVQKYLHQAILRLRWLREAWDAEHKFEQKRRRATSMIHAQAGLLSILYAGLSYFTFSRYEYFTIRNYLNLSITLFAVGIIALFAIERSFRWKV